MTETKFLRILHKIKNKNKGNFSHIANKLKKLESIWNIKESTLKVVTIM